MNQASHDAVARLLARFTPGEWRAANWTCHAPTTILTKGEDGRTVVVAECSGHGRYTDDSIEDAQLLAAAKELLASSVMAAGAIAGAITCFREAGFPKTADVLQEDLQVLVAAIAKAIGSAS